MYSMQNNLNEDIYSFEDVLSMLDSFFKEPNQFWDNFYSDRNKKIPFFTNEPDENLVSYFDKKVIKPGNVLELGCGAGRNSIYMAFKGCTVDAVDLSSEALSWANDKVKNNEDVSINFINKSIFDLDTKESFYDIIYDSGCLHHIPPHRRPQYVNLINRSLKPGGFFGLTCFAGGDEAEGKIPVISDWEVYRQKSMRGGLGYTEEKLKRLFSNNFKVIESRIMKDNIPNTMQGTPFIWTILFRKK